MAGPKRALVTGGAGCVGSNLVVELLRRGWQVRALDDFSAGKHEHLKGIPSDRFELREGDIRNLQVCEQACRNMEYVFHQAAIRSVSRSMDDPQATNEVNVRGTLNMLQAAQKAGVRRFVYASSSSVYGDATQLPQEETQRPQPVSPYAVSKLAGENYCLSFAKTTKLETVSLRYFNVYGPNQDPESKYSLLIPAFLAQAGRGEPFEVHGDGLQARDFSFVGDVVAANLLAAQTPNVSGEIFNVAGGKSISVLDVAQAIVNIIGKDPGKRHTDRRPGDVRTTWASIERAKKLLGFQPSVDFEEGLRRSVDYFRSTGWLG
ncbi:MAG: SDR family oxidoreductase [Acidobacteria bacterium]|nr:SDR family oxidoreductase [Acidobacteriota bacterium]